MTSQSDAAGKGLNLVDHTFIVGIAQTQILTVGTLQGLNGDVNSTGDLHVPVPKAHRAN